MPAGSPATRIDDVVAAAVEEARGLTGAAGATLLLREGDDLRIRHAVGTADAGDLEGTILAPGSSKSHGVLARRRAEIVVDLAADPEANRHVLELLGHPADGAFAPLMVGDRCRGVLAVFGSAPGRPFAPATLAVLQVLANLIATALENDRLAAKLAELAVLEERERSAQELHDGVIQSVYSVGLTLQASLALMAGDPRLGARRIEDAIRELDNVVWDVRNHLHEVHPQRLAGRGLEAAVRTLVRELEVNTTAHASLSLCPQAGDVLGPDHHRQVIQIVRAVLSNIARHAEAGHVRVATDVAGDAFTLTIEDDGVGFDPGTVPWGRGLTTVHAHVGSMGGTVSIAPRPGGGTVLTVRVPIPLLVAAPPADTHGDGL